MCCSAWLQDGATPIFVAAQNGHKGCIELLASLGGDVSTARPVSSDGIVLAVSIWWCGKVACAPCWLGRMVWCSHRVAVRMCDCVQSGATPIYVAAENGHKECAEVLAALGSDVNAAMSVSVDAVAQAGGGTHDGELLWASVAVFRPIHIAAYRGHMECIELLAGLGGNVNTAMTVSVDVGLGAWWWVLSHC